jgi:VWFA-related protein
VTGLTRDNFHVFDGGVEQRIVQLSRDETPMAVGLVFDTSLSMTSKLQAAREAAAAFLATANPDDEFFLIEFQDHALVTQPFTSDPRDIRTRLAQARAKGHTALLDAIQLGIQELRKSSKPRKALVLLSDGGDNRSRFSESELTGMVRESDVLIYSMGLGKPGHQFLPEQDDDGSLLLDRLTRESGGRLYAVDDSNGLPDVAARIGQELHNRYVLAYAPANGRTDGKYHKVQVKVTPPRGLSSLQVSWRPGYFGPSF